MKIRVSTAHTAVEMERPQNSLGIDHTFADLFAEVEARSAMVTLIRVNLQTWFCVKRGLGDQFDPETQMNRLLDGYQGGLWSAEVLIDPSLKDGEVWMVGDLVDDFGKRDGDEVRLSTKLDTLPEPSDFAEEKQDLRNWLTNCSDETLAPRVRGLLFRYETGDSLCP